MADIALEVESLRDFVVDPTLFSRIWMQYLPDKYTAGELSIRYQGGNTASETGYHYRLDREYQFVYFGATELDCIRKATALQRKLNSTHAIPLKGSERFIRVGPFSMSPPFKSEGGEVFGFIGVLQAEMREARPVIGGEVPKIGGITIEVKPKPPGSENDNGTDTEYPDKEFEIGIGNGECK